MALPIPEPAPVTTATRPLKLGLFSVMGELDAAQAINGTDIPVLQGGRLKVPVRFSPWI